MTPMRRLFNMLFEKPETADDLYRRLDAIEELIARGATDGEKDAARKAKERLEQTIKTKFPGAVKQPKQAKQAERPAASGGFWDDIVRGADAYHKQQERYAADPEAERQDKLAEIERLTRRRKELSRWRGMGNVEVEEEYKHVAATLERLMAKWQPEEYAELVKKREASGKRAAEKRYADRDEKIKAGKNADAKAGRVPLKDILKDNKDICARLSKALSGKVHQAGGVGAMKWKADASSLRYLLHTLPHFGIPVLRDAFNTLAPEEQATLKAAVTNASEKIWDQSWTPAQRNKVLGAFTPHAPDKETLKKNYEAGLQSGKIQSSQIAPKHVELLAPLFKSRNKTTPEQRAQYALTSIKELLRKPDDNWSKEDLKSYARKLKGKDTSALIADLKNVLTDGPLSSSKVMRQSDQENLINFFSQV